MPMSRLCGGTLVDRLAVERRSRRGSAISNPASIISAVVLPEPEGPSRVRNSPLPMSRSRPFDDQRLAVIGLLYIAEPDERAGAGAHLLPDLPVRSPLATGYSCCLSPGAGAKSRAGPDRSRPG